MGVPPRTRQLLLTLGGVLFGVGYGLFARYAFDHPSEGASQKAIVAAFVAMSICFLFLVPLGIGVGTALFGPRSSRWRWAYWGLMPIVNCALLLGVVMALAWEGLICLVMAAPIYFAMAVAGGVVTGTIIAMSERRHAPPPTTALASALLLPFLLAPAEARLPVEDQLRDVHTAIAIRADAATVWREIVRVPEIREHEQRPGLFHRIGIPQPLEATLDAERIGGIRLARFKGGIVFHETVTEWEPEKGFAFAIRVDPASIGTSLDEHVTVGARHFDVVHGRFRIEPAGDGVVLHLTSRHRLSTRFNAYAGLWTDAVMADIQDTVCEVIRRRAESAKRAF